MIFFCYAFIDGEKYVNSYDYALSDKKKLLQEGTEGNRIILVGGSNVSFGFCSPVLEKKLRRRTINTAIYAGYGRKFTMDFVAPHIRKNDIVILIPEYSQYFSDDFDGVSGGLILPVDADFSNLKLLNFEQILEQLPQIPKTGLGKLKSFVKYQIKGGYSDDLIPYLRTSFNSHGDAVAHWKINSSPVPKDEDLSGLTFNEDIFDYMVYFQSYCKSRNATCLVSYPSFARSVFKKNLQLIQEIEKKLMEHSLRLLGEPCMFSFSDDEYFDSNYHLKKYAQIKRTELIAELLKKYE